MTTRFDRDTAVEREGESAFRTRIDPGWWVVMGPNGGYLAALLLRALTQAVDDPERHPRSLTIHFTLPPEAGPARIETRVERRGGSLTTISGRLLQGEPRAERLVALALAAFSKPRRGGFAHADLRMPAVPPPERCAPLEHQIEIHQRYEQRWAVGSPPFSRSHEARSGGWIRLADSQEGRQAPDAALAAAYTDAFPPAIFAVLGSREESRGVPTLDLTIHFRVPLPLAGARPDDWTLAAFRTRLSHQGFLEEDGELWSADGRLLVQSRQLALAR